MSSHSPFTPPPTPGNHWSTLCLWICLFWTFHINGILHFMAFCDWLLLFTVMFSRFIHTVAHASASFLLIAEFIPLRMDHILCIHLLLDGHSGCRHMLAILCASFPVHIRFHFSWACTWEWNCWVFRLIPCVSLSVVSDSSRPHGLSPSRLLCPWDSVGRNTGVACHSLLSTQVSRMAGEFFIVCSTREAHNLSSCQIMFHGGQTILHCYQPRPSFQFLHILAHTFHISDCRHPGGHEV